MSNARARLTLARRVAQNAGIAEKSLINLGGDTWALFPWLGSYAFMALERFLKLRCGKLLGLRSMKSCKPYYLQFCMDADEKRFYEVLAQAAKIPFSPMELLYEGEVPYFEKYDLLLPKELIRKGFAYGVLDIEGMLFRVGQWCGFSSGPLRNITRAE